MVKKQVRTSYIHARGLKKRSSGNEAAAIIEPEAFDNPDCRSILATIVETNTTLFELRECINEKARAIESTQRHIFSLTANLSILTETLTRLANHGLAVQQELNCVKKQVSLIHKQQEEDFDPTHDTVILDPE